MKQKNSITQTYAEELRASLVAQWLKKKKSACSAGDTGETGSIPGWRRSPGRGDGNLLQYSCLGNPMDRRAWQNTVRGVTKSQTGLTMHAMLH